MLTYLLAYLLVSLVGVQELDPGLPTHPKFVHLFSSVAQGPTRLLYFVSLGTIQPPFSRPVSDLGPFVESRAPRHEVSQT